MITLDGIGDIRIYQNKKGYRFSLDALLLSAFVTLRKARRICDLGAGSGVIGLLLARRYPDAMVALVELQENLSTLAGRNIILNDLRDRVVSHNADIAAILSDPPLLPHGAFDLVVSNPPFRKPKTGLLSAGDERSIARHELRLSLEVLVRSGAALLAHHGRFCLIHLPERLADIVESMRREGIEPKRMRMVHSRMTSEAKMVLIEGVRGGRPGLRAERPLCVYRNGYDYAAEVRSLQKGHRQFDL